MLTKKKLPIEFFGLKSGINFLLLGSLLLIYSCAIAEIEYSSIAENAVVMYDAPSLKADKLYVASLHLPVEIVVSLEGWTKVRDSSGNLAWVERKALSQQRYVVVVTPFADIHESPEASSTLIFQAEENVVMEWLDSEVKGWVKVRHSDGQVGYIKVNQVWGS
jgi:SH3-like domain-containing protein